jgi:hypothetical protein
MTSNYGNRHGYGDVDVLGHLPGQEASTVSSRADIEKIVREYIIRLPKC